MEKTLVATKKVAPRAIQQFFTRDAFLIVAAIGGALYILLTGLTAH